MYNYQTCSIRTKINIVIYKTEELVAKKNGLRVLNAINYA